MTHNSREASRPLRVLVVDDSLVQQKQAVGLLKSLQCEVAIANDGLQAVTAVRESDFDLVLMDVEMPEMDGLAATREIRRRERGTGSHIPIAATTTLLDREPCLAAGMDAFVRKPLRPEMLTTLIRRLVTEPGSRGDGEGKSILLADDDRQIAIPLGIALEARGYEVIAAIDGQQALDLTHSRQPDLIILDVMMPKRSGISVLEELRQGKFETPIIMITGTEDRRHRDSALELGVNDFIRKPFRLERVVHSVKKLLAA